MSLPTSALIKFNNRFSLSLQPEPLIKKCQMTSTLITTKCGKLRNICLESEVEVVRAYDASEPEEPSRRYRTSIATN